MNGIEHYHRVIEDWPLSHLAELQGALSEELAHRGHAVAAAHARATAEEMETIAAKFRTTVPA